MTTAHVDIVVPLVWSGVYLNIARLLKYSLEDMNLRAIIIEAGEKQQVDLSIIFASHSPRSRVANASPGARRRVTARKAIAVYGLEA